MPHIPQRAELMAAVETSLRDLAALSDSRGDLRLRAMVVRRRSLVLAARKASGRGPARPWPAPSRPRAMPPPGIDAVIEAEWRLARLIAAVLRTLPPGDPLLAPLSALRDEVEDGALLLRVVSRGGA
jgi:hypothetical protein